MMYVLDSSAIIELIKGTENSEKIIHLLGEELLVTTTICMHEVLAGADKPQDKFILNNVLSCMKILEHTPEAARAGAEIYQEQTKLGKKASEMDILVAAICKTNNATLVTSDKGFEKIKAIKSITL